MAVSDPGGGAPAQEPEAPITLEMLSSLRVARPWALFLALYGFLGAVLTAWSALIAWTQPGGGLAGAAQWGFAMVCLLVSFPLFRFAQAVGRARPGSGVAPVEAALAQQLTLFRFLGIAALLELALVVLAISIPLVQELRPPDRGEPPPSFSSIGQGCDARAMEFLCAAVAAFDAGGRLTDWTGWHTLTREQGSLELRSHSSGQVSLRYSGREGRNTWQLALQAPRGKALLPGEYTGARSAGGGDVPYMSLSAPPAWYPGDPVPGQLLDDWYGECPPQIFTGEEEPIRYPARAKSESRFTVRQILWTRDGEVRRISVDFERSCATSEGTWLLLGRFHATNHDYREPS